MNTFTLSFLMTMVACESKWSTVDVDGDGVLAVDGDCWDSNEDPVPPEGAEDYGLKASDISPDAEEDLPYDGIDQNCDGKDDFDVDGDGFVPEMYAGIVTLGIETSGALPAGDCWDNPADDPESLEMNTLNDFPALSAAIVFPGAVDSLYDGVNQDCGDNTYEYDSDQDGFDSSTYIRRSGDYGDDCNDEDSTIFPTAEEGIADGIDQNCDNDELCYVDEDSDGFAGESTALIPDLTCTETAGYHPIIEDCDDADAKTHPGAAPNDSADDCMTDSDGDDYGDSAVASTIVAGTDCNDADGAIFPGAVEGIADAVDQNCDEQELCYQDGDGDGDGDELGSTSLSVDLSCSSSGVSANNTDCDDSDAFTNVGAALNETDGATLCMKDSDVDGFGDQSPPGGVFSGTDCNDAKADVNPSITEQPATNEDQDCDGTELCYVDLDGDTYGTADTVASNNLSCVDSGEAENADDCDDISSTTFPGAAENESTIACMNDDDGDGYGDNSTAGSFVSGTDCDDLEPTTYPQAEEIAADAVDQDCDGVDNCYQDLDGDGDGSGVTVVGTTASCSAQGESNDNSDCDDSDELTYVGAAPNDDPNACLKDTDGDDYGDLNPGVGIDAGTDCNDNDEQINPSIQEAVNTGVDQDCDGLELCYRDLDGDTYGTVDLVESSNLSCLDSGESENTDDCDDGDNKTYPGAAPNDSATGCMTDADGDDYGDDSPASGVNAGTDCNDAKLFVNPSVTEQPATKEDQDCDGFELCYRDLDNDTYGTADLINSNNLSCTDDGESESSDDCDDGDNKTFPGAAPNDSASACMTDVDGDDYGDSNPDSGISVGSDCNDATVAIGPDVSEIAADGIDQDCDGFDNCYEDGDNDGFGSSVTIAGITADCSATGESVLNTDCNDADDSIHPNATEGVADGVDQNCDNNELCYDDADNDNYGNAGAATRPSLGNISCTNDDFEADNTDDCDDSSSSTFPGAALQDSATACMKDADGDGYGDLSPPAGIVVGSDCNDADGTINPSAIEGVADGVDQDCNGDEICYMDNDQDGYGRLSPVLTVVSPQDLSCNDPGESTVKTDCDDGKAHTYPGAAENDSSIACMKDADGDGYGDDSPSAGIAAGSDCNDGNGSINPSVNEICDAGNVDENCNGSADDNDSGTLDSGKTTYYPDGDNDSYGDQSNSGTRYCDPQAGMVTNASDCDDTRPAINPAGTEICDSNNRDENCNGSADDNDSSTLASSKTTYYTDGDGDTYGDENDAGTAYCDPPSGVSTNNDDCNDGASGVNPGATEVCDTGNVDENCNGSADDNDISTLASSKTTYYTDGDGDSYGDENDLGTAYCDPPSGVSINNDDCNDGASAINPAATEGVADGVDQDCDDIEYCYQDVDGDDFGTASLVNSSNVSCTDSGESEVSTDCDDGSAVTFPGAAPKDSSNSCMKDADGDDFGDNSVTGAVVAGSDCNDNDNTINTDATELTADGVDQDCDNAEICYIDADQDGYGANTTTPSPSIDCSALGVSSTNTDCLDSDDKTYPGAAGSDSSTACMTDADGDGYGDQTPTGGAAAGTDCNDSASGVNPGATEVCNSIDDDCDGDTDDDDSFVSNSSKSDWYHDFDGDTFGDPDDTQRACVAPTNYVADNTDCDDNELYTFPGAAELESTTDCMRDFDEDGYGDDSTTGLIIAGVDCDDSEQTTYPYAPEVISDGVDSNCDNFESDDLVVGGVQCSGDWNTDESAYFLWCEDTVTKDTADSYCQQGGHYDALASVASSTDNDDLLSVAGASTGVFWIGYVDELVEGSFGWLDESGFSFTNWCTISSGCGNDEPNGGTAENCASVLNTPTSTSNGLSGLWIDDNCAASRAFSCSHRP